MKSLIKKNKKPKSQPTAACCAPATDPKDQKDLKVAQCCAKQSKLVAGCHD